MTDLELENAALKASIKDLRELNDLHRAEVRQIQAKTAMDIGQAIAKLSSDTGPPK